MSFINELTKDLVCKVIYFGTGMSGKTTNVQHVFERSRQQPNQQGRLMTLGSENERTLFFDFLPLSVGDVGTYKTRLHLYSVPGQTFYETSRHFILKGVDGVVFVVDSQEDRMEANIESFDSLQRGLEQQGYDVGRIPLVFQYNKRDLPGILPITELQATFNSAGRPYFESVANHGTGVMETLQGITKLILDELKGGK